MQDRNILQLTELDAAAYAGRSITDAEYERLVKAIEWSSIPEAFGEVVFAVCGYDDGTGEPYDQDA